MPGDAVVCPSCRARVKNPMELRRHLKTCDGIAPAPPPAPAPAKKAAPLDTHSPQKKPPPLTGVNQPLWVDTGWPAPAALNLSWPPSQGLVPQPARSTHISRFCASDGPDGGSMPADAAGAAPEHPAALPRLAIALLVRAAPPTVVDGFLRWLSHALLSK